MNINVKPISDFGKRVVDRIKDKIERRKKAQENFRNRKDNTNYYESASYWEDNTN